MHLTDYGSHAAQQGEQERRRLLAQLIDGTAQISDYTKGICYDTVAFCFFLDGRLRIDQLLDVDGQAWLPILSFDAGVGWQDESITPGKGVGFKRVGDQMPGYFHAALAVGGSWVRGVNAMDLTAGWSAPFDLATLGTATEGYWHDGQPIELRYV